MKKKKLKSSSSHFLSQNIWRILRNLLGKKLWTYFYKHSQKIKSKKKIDLLKKKKLSLMDNLNYPILERNQNGNIKKFSFYLDKFNTSKPPGEYREFLDDLFLNKQDKFKTILEIGISEGAGIFSLKEYFYNSYLWGVDIDPETFIYNDEKIKKCDFVDQLNINSLIKNAEKFNTKYDLIIDDGWHHPESQINSLIAYLPYLNLNGIYIVEDIVHRDYFELFEKVKNVLEQKNFEVIYKKFFVPGDAEISDLLGYMIIKRMNQS